MIFDVDVDDWELMYVCRLVSDGAGAEEGIFGYGTNTGGFDRCFSLARREKKQSRAGMMNDRKERMNEPAERR